MEHITVGRKHNEVKVAFAECVKNGTLKNIDITGRTLKDSTTRHKNTRSFFKNYGCF